MSGRFAASIVASSFALGLACGGAGGGSSGGPVAPNPCTGGKSCGAVALQLQAVNSAAQALPQTLHVARPAAVAAPAWLSGGILSGPPDELRLYLKRIAAAPATGGEYVELYASPEARGTLLTLTSGAVDLAAALGAAGFVLPPGDYGKLRLDVSRVAEVKGCVSGAFMVTAPASGTLSPEMIAAAPKHGTNVYTNDPITDGQVHTFCTRSGANEVTVGTFTTDPIGSNAWFQGVSAPERTEIDLALDNATDLGADARRADTLTVETPARFSVAAGGTQPLTLAMDLDRMLRYFANTRSDLQPVNPNMKTGTSYFFTTVFASSALLVPGAAGSVEGYQLSVVAARTGGGSEVVPGWLTVLRDASGAVTGGLVMGDDDNGLTVAKGNLDPAAAPAAGAGVELVYRLGTGGDGQPFSGTLTGFRFTAQGASGSCPLTLTGASWLSSYTGFTAYYTRKL